MNFLYLKGNNGPVMQVVFFSCCLPSMYLHLAPYRITVTMGKTIGAVMEELFLGDKVPLTDSQVEQLLHGWLDRLHPELEALFLDNWLHLAAILNVMGG